jgi:hypothetical protein
MRPQLPGSATTQTVVVHRPNPVAAWLNAALDLGYTRSISGRSGGAIRAGEPASSTVKFSGDLGQLQKFTNASPHAVTRGLRTTPNTALPSSAAPVTSSLLDPMAAAQMPGL